jgi:cyclase
MLRVLFVMIIPDWGYTVAMRKSPLPVLLLALACASAGFSQTNDVRQLAPGVYTWGGDADKRIIANCTWVIFKDYVFVVDANFPWGAREILPRIRATTNKPIRYVLNTHYHGDHAYGNSAFVDAGATIVSSEATADELGTKGANSWNGWKDAEHPFTGARLEPASVTYTDKMILDDGTQRVELIRLGPAHSRGDSVAYLPKQKIVVTGDLCVTWLIGNNVADPDANYEGWLKALATMESWDPMIVVPGHGSPSSKAALTAQREYLADMLAQVQAGKKAGKTADQLVSEIDLSKHGGLASGAAGNAASIRAMYKHP